MQNSKHEKPLDSTTFLRIRKWYISALAGITLTIIIAQLLIQKHLYAKGYDSRVINIAGRQGAFPADLIKGEHTATFNLTPPELSSHGIFPALHKKTVELSKLSGKTIAKAVWDFFL